MSTHTYNGLAYHFLSIPISFIIHYPLCILPILWPVAIMVVYVDKSLVHEVLEDSGDFVYQVVEDLGELLAIDLGVLELHLLQFVQLDSSLALQEGEVYPVGTLGSLHNGALGQLVVTHDCLHHAGGLNGRGGTFSRGQVKSCSEKAFCWRNSFLMIPASSRVSF